MRKLQHGRLRARRAVAASLALLLASAPLPAELSFSVRTSAGLAGAIGREIVYDNGARAGYLLSVLAWQTMPLLFARTEWSVLASSGATASLALTSGMLAPRNDMTDRDFLNFDGAITHFSRHDCYTEQALMADLRGGWRFALVEGVSLEPFLALSAMRFRWSARDGYLQYPPEPSPPYTPWNPAAVPVRLHGTGVIYRQDALYPSLGAALSLSSPGAPEVVATIAVSPLVLFRDVDNHLLRQTDFYEGFAGGFALEPGLSLLWRLSDRASVDLDYSYRHVGGLVGDSYEVGTGIEGQDPGAGERSALFRKGAGAAFYFLRGSLGFTLSL